MASDQDIFKAHIKKDHTERDLTHVHGHELDAILEKVKAFFTTSDPSTWDRHSVRSKLHNVLKAPACEWTLGLVILVNLAVLIKETDDAAPRGTLDNPVEGVGPSPVIVAFNNLLLLIYTVELALRLYVMRLSFFADSWCVMDFMIVSTDIVLFFCNLILDGNLPKLVVLRCFRLIRLARAFKALAMFPELNYLLRGFACAFQAIFWGVIMVLVVLVIWSILAVQLVHQTNRVVAADDRNIYDGCHRCPEAFSSVWNSLMTFTQQLVAGDSWGQVSLPIIEKEPYLFFFFLAVLVTVSLAIMNLILAVIVDSGQQARQDAIQEKITAKAHEFDNATRLFADLCLEIDSDGSGSLTMEELHNGFDEKIEFADTMKMMGLERTDLEVIFRVMDQDLSGDLNYTEFIDEMRNVRSSEVHSMLIFVKFAVQDIRFNLQRRMDELVLRVEGVLPEMGTDSKKLSIASEKSVDSTKDGALPTAAGEPAKPQRPAAIDDVKLEAKWEPVPNPCHVLPGPARDERRVPDELVELRHVNQELVSVMRDVSRHTAAHTRILGSLERTLPLAVRGAIAGGTAPQLKGVGAETSETDALADTSRGLGSEGTASQPHRPQTTQHSAVKRPGAAAVAEFQGEASETTEPVAAAENEMQM